MQFQCSRWLRHWSRLGNFSHLKLSQGGRGFTEIWLAVSLNLWAERWYPEWVTGEPVSHWRWTVAWGLAARSWRRERPESAYRYSCVDKYGGLPLKDLASTKKQRRGRAALRPSRYPGSDPRSPRDDGQIGDERAAVAASGQAGLEAGCTVLLVADSCCPRCTGRGVTCPVCALFGSMAVAQQVKCCTHKVDQVTFQNEGST